MGRTLVKSILLGPVVLILFSGCFWHRVDYSTFGPRCREWVKNIDGHGSLNYIIENMPDIESRFSCYMCVNMARGNRMVPGGILFTDPQKALVVLVAGLSEYKDDIAV